MERTSGSIKTLAAAAGVAVLAGLAVVLYGLTHDDLARSIGGLGVTILGLTVLGLIAIRHWITNTRQDQLLLAAAQREAQAERSRYFAARVTLEVEQDRLRRDLDAERRALAARMQAEREAMRQDFETRRGDLIAETMEATFRMLQSDKLNTEHAMTGRLIQFPRQHPEPQPAPARSREHGVVGP
jgi:hypothetical protein